MAGVSLVTADNWIISYFASDTGGAVAQMNYAKQFFTAPMAMLAQATGAASMPFFASLWTQGKHYEFANEVADSVSRVAALGLLVASGMVALGKPAIALVFTGGRFSVADANLCAAYFAVFSVSIFLWSAQAIYARAFYAAGNTRVPMIAGTIVTVISLPIYAVLHRSIGVIGLAIASDIGILLQTGSIAVLLHKRRMVSLAGLDFAELGRCLLASVSGGAAVWLVFTEGLSYVGHLLHRSLASRWIDLAILIAGSAVWLVIVRWVLERTGSALPRVVMKRLRLAK
jgi:putative peptidoglycan lipid II flippase